MFTGEFKFSLHDIFKSYGDRPQYNFAYLCTNEPIEQWLKLTPIDRPRVLTVAASGDQPLMYAAAGAARVDTFDITINACAIMDFKTTAMTMLDYSKYMDIIMDLNTFRLIAQYKQVMIQEYKQIQRIVSHMPARTHALMNQALEYNPGLFRRSSLNSFFPQDAQTYRRIQKQSAGKHFNFIWADLMNVSNYIGTQEYDIIYLSNIFDHYLVSDRSTDDIYATLQKLWPHLSDNGYVMFTSLYNASRYNKRTLRSLLPNAKIELPPAKPEYKNWTPIIIHKSR